MAKRKLELEISAKNATGRAIRGVMQGLGRLRRFAGGVASSVMRVFKRVSLTLTGIGAAIGLTLRAYAKQQAAEEALANALRNHGDAVDDLVPKYKAFASAIQQRTVYGDEDLLQLMALARNMGIAADELEGATKAAVGLADAYSIDLRTAIQLVAKARAGDTSVLRRYGIILDDTLSTQEKFNALLAIGTRSFRQSEARAATLSGRFRQLRNAFGDVLEQIGQSISDGIKLPDLLSSITARIANWGSTLKDKLLPYMERYGQLLRDIIAGGDARKSAFSEIAGDLQKAATMAGEVLVDWGERAGRAIWRGFKNSIKGAGFSMGFNVGDEIAAGYDEIYQTQVRAMRDLVRGVGTGSPAAPAVTTEPFMRGLPSVPPSVQSLPGWNPRAGQDAAHPLHVMEVNPSGVQ